MRTIHERTREVRARRARAVNYTGSPVRTQVSTNSSTVSYDDGEQLIVTRPSLGAVARRAHFHVTAVMQACGRCPDALRLVSPP